MMVGHHFGADFVSILFVIRSLRQLYPVFSETTVKSQSKTKDIYVPTTQSNPFSVQTLLGL